MINRPPSFKGLNIGIPIIITIKGSGFINQGSTLGDIFGIVWKATGVAFWHKFQFSFYCCRGEPIHKPAGGPSRYQQATLTLTMRITMYNLHNVGEGTGVQGGVVGCEWAAVAL